ncbi:MAG: OmpA family protein [Acidobacteriota bacterium]
MRFPFRSFRSLDPVVFRVAAGVAVVVAATGCVSEKKMQTYVDQRVESVETRVDDVETQVEETQDQVAEQERRLDEQEKMLENASTTARQAFERAVAAGQLAEGKLLYETTLSDADVRFDVNSSGLSEGARTALDAFANDLKARQAAVFLEIQGHTDSTGPERYNLELGEERASATRQYLNREHSIPLHRMSIISYGETAPVADNASRDGRRQNRRVVLVVLQ